MGRIWGRWWWRRRRGRWRKRERGAGGREAGSKAGDCGLASVGVQSAIRNPKSAIGVSAVDLYRSLRGVVSRTPTDRKIAIADSKQLYKPGLGLRQLERGLHAVLVAMRQTLDCWSTLVDGVGADPDGHHRSSVLA